MEAKFWHQKWADNQIGFHMNEANPLLVKYFSELGLAKGSRIFLPLCGKTLDIDWLLAGGHKVVGAELSSTAVDQLFARLQLKPQITQHPSGLAQYSATNITIFVGDIFNLTANLLGSVAAIYDRAALVALPEAMRQRYSAHVITITNQAPQLLINYEYDQKLIDGPPFSVSDSEIRKLYQNSYNLTLLASVEMPNGMKGKCPATERVWVLRLAKNEL